MSNDSNTPASTDPTQPGPWEPPSQGAASASGSATPEPSGAISSGDSPAAPVPPAAPSAPEASTQWSGTPAVPPPGADLQPAPQYGDPTGGYAAQPPATWQGDQGLGLPPGVTIADPWTRFGSALLEGLLAFVTLYIGWIIWAAMLADKGQTPAKKILNLRVVDSTRYQPADFMTMFFMRGIVGGFVAQFAFLFTLGVLIFMPFWDSRKQNIWDKISSTLVVSDPGGVYNTPGPR